MRGTSVDRRVKIIKALAHPARLRIVESLAVAERTVGELHSLVGGDLSTVSKHLTLMRQAGWIACAKHGQHVHYHLACDCLPTFLRCVDGIGAAESPCAC